jgi:ubiquinone/menaquinone biosynthesis C-methylase UbiE
MNHSIVQKNYNRMSRFYDLFAGASERRFLLLGLKLLNIQPGENILEIGFGTGHGLVGLAQAVGISSRVTGIDISEGMLRVTDSRLKKSGFSDQVDLLLGDAACLPCISTGFDAVFISFTLELFSAQEIPAFLKECRRVLNKEGRLGVVALEKRNCASVRMYEWVHSLFPSFIDCHPINVQKVVVDAGFRIMEMVERRTWGLPVIIISAGKLN